MTLENSSSGLLRLRRGPWEMLATNTSSSRWAEVMLMQPFFLWAFTWSFLVTLEDKPGTVMFIIDLASSPE
jgi:hypothetical protein